VDDEKIIMNFKSSLMKNKHLKHLFAYHILLSQILAFNFSKTTYFPCLGIFNSPWSNKTLECIQGNYSSEELKNFVLMNTPVKEILRGIGPRIELDLIDELKWNYHLIHIENHIPVPMYFYYIERNKELAKIQKISKEILKIKTFDICFQFNL
jgi:hypothetical protein